MSNASNRSHKLLQGKTALVTGGSRGIGAAIARRLAADGANVAIGYSAPRTKLLRASVKWKAKASAPPFSGPIKATHPKSPGW